jgi:hypothetical protein
VDLLTTAKLEEKRGMRKALSTYHRYQNTPISSFWQWENSPINGNATLCQVACQTPLCGRVRCHMQVRGYLLSSSGTAERGRPYEPLHLNGTWLNRSEKAALAFSDYPVNNQN